MHYFFFWHEIEQRIKLQHLRQRMEERIFCPFSYYCFLFSTPFRNANKMISRMWAKYVQIHEKHLKYKFICRQHRKKWAKKSDSKRKKWNPSHEIIKATEFIATQVLFVFAFCRHTLKKGHLKAVLSRSRPRVWKNGEKIQPPAKSFFFHFF